MNKNTNTTTQTPEPISLYDQRTQILERLRKLAIEGILQKADAAGALTAAVKGYVSISKKLQRIREVPAEFMEYAQACYTIIAAEYQEKDTANVEVFCAAACEHPPLITKLIDVNNRLLHTAKNPSIKLVVKTFGDYLIKTKIIKPTFKVKVLWWLSIGLPYRLMLGVCAEQISHTMQTETYNTNAKLAHRIDLNLYQTAISRLIGENYVVFPSLQNLQEPINLRLFIRVSNVAEQGSHLAPTEKHTEVLRLLTRLNQIEDELKSETEEV